MSKSAYFQSLNLTGNFSQASDAFSPFIQALYSQAVKLGIRFEDRNNETAPNELHLALSEQDGIAFTVMVTTPIVDGEVCGEGALQVLTGLASVHSRSLDRQVTLGVDYISIAGASLVVQQLFAGLTGKHRGMTCDQTVFDLRQAGLLAVGQYMAGATTASDPECFSSGQSDPSVRPPFTSKDGVLFELESLSPQRWQAFWLSLGAAPKDVSQGWHAFMQRYAKAIAPLPPAMPSLLAEHDFSDLEKVAIKEGVAITAVRSLQARREDDDVEALLSQGPWHFMFQQSDSVCPLPFSTEPGGLPLSGISIVESCRRIQGPLAGYILAALGASVTRIEPLGGDPLRGMPPLADDCSARFSALNGNKQVIEVDIKSEAGRAQVTALSGDADMFIHNWAPGKAAELRLDMTELSKANPDLVYVYAGGWGQMDSTIQIPGTDFMAQAYSGLADVISRHSGIPGGTLFTATDVFGGILAAQAAVMALYCRVKGQSGIYAESSLLGAATLLTEPALQGDACDCSSLMHSDYIELASLSSANETEPFLTTRAFTQLSSLWRPQ